MGFMQVIDDVRECCFPIWCVNPKGFESGNVSIENGKYLGTGFFITKNGIALTAGHCVPSIVDLDGDLLAAIVWDGREYKAHKIVSAFQANAADISILKVEISGAKWLDLDFDEKYMGEDLSTFGYPANGTGSCEVRTFKGYITQSSRFYELNFPAPKGLSGSPVVAEKYRVVGVLTGNSKSEQIEDQVEEIITQSNEKEVIKIIESKSIMNYALVEPIYKFRDVQFEFCEGNGFRNFINERNKA